MNRKTASITLVGLSICLAACGSSKTGTTTTTSTTLAPSTHLATRTYSDKAEGFSVAAPTGWTEDTVDTSTLSQIENALNTNPQLAPEEAALKGPDGKYIKMLILNPLGDQNLTVLVVPLPSGTAIDTSTASQLESGVVGGLKGAPGVTAKAGKVTTINGHLAFEVTLTYTTQLEGQSVPQQEQYYFLSAKSVYSLDVLGTSTAETNQIIQSFQIPK